MLLVQAGHPEHEVPLSSIAQRKACGVPNLLEEASPETGAFWAPGLLTVAAVKVAGDCRTERRPED